MLEGPTDLHAHLLGSREQLLADARATALGLGEDVAWVEKIVVATEPQRAPASPSSPTASATCSKRNARDEEFVAAVETDIAELVRRLPHEVRSEPGGTALAAAVNGEVAELIAGIAPELHARLCAS